jgi:deazaflavin-dependent oxidoreductase (nitroreductase family)
MPAAQEDEPKYLYLTTTGRRTGLPREIEIWFTHHDGRYYLISEKLERSAWVRNIQQNPSVEFRVGDRNFSGSARVLDRSRDQQLWVAVSELSDQKYGWSDGLIVELTPEPQAVDVEPQGENTEDTDSYTGS